MSRSSNRQQQNPKRQAKRPLHLHNSCFYDEDYGSLGTNEDRPHVPIRTATATTAPTPSNRQSNNMDCQRRRPPLVLDAAQVHAHAQKSPQSLALSSSALVVSSAVSSRVFQSPPTHSQTTPASSTTSQSANFNSIANATLDESALAFARQAPLAGYLNKQDSSTCGISSSANKNNNLQPIFKRRFFVVQPATHLYYFLTAHDTAPRGCLDLHGARVERIRNEKHDEEQKDTVYRFALVWDGDESKSTAINQNRIVLEARSQEEADHWIQALEEQRLSYSQEALRKAQLHQSAQRSRILELEQQLAQYRHMETEKGLAEQEALQWQRQFERLDEGIRKLTRQLLRRPSRLLSRQMSTSAQDEKKQEEEKNPLERQDLTENHLPNGSDDEEDIRHVPGSTYFAGLANTVEQLRENLRLASDEAATAVEDVVTAQTQLQAIQARMTKAEQHLLKIWEENCALRKQLKQKKREKRVLVREVKNLRQAARTVSRDLIRQSMESMQASGSLSNNNNNSDEEMDDDNNHHGNSRNDDEIGELDDYEDEEDKLIHDLEKHVQSSLRLHEQFMAANGEIQSRLGGANHLDTSLEVSIDQDLRRLLDSTVELASTGKKMKRMSSSPKIHPNVPLFETQTTLPGASLFDNSEEEDDDDNESHSVVSSVRAQASDTEPLIMVPRKNPNLMDDSSVDECSLERPNPILQLDEEIGCESETQAPQLCATYSQSESSSGVASARQATSKLACPLADVVSTHSYGPREAASSDICNSNHHNADDLTVYHLTFYSRKIGIQFQKVPPPPMKPRGLLTDALTADLANVSAANENTAAELRRIAAISTRGKSSDPKKGKPAEQTTCDVATPLDAVLVCGFEGFDDDSGNNERPRLGARLVAFDGVSIEVGQWTFESVRKSIQARGRPLTLSFRNDFLTTEQRRILTKAVQDMQKHQEQPSPSSLLPPLPASSSTLSHGSGAHSDDLSASGASGSDFISSTSGLLLPQSFSGANSRNSSSHYNYHHGRSSFSEVQSTTSSSVFSAVAPLVANLLSNSSGKGSSNSFRRLREPFTPEYLRRAPTSVEETPQHQDFQSELL